MKAQLTTRPGGVSRKMVPQPDGSTVTQLQFEFSKLPAPERNFLAECVGVEDTGEGFRLLFGQQGRKKALRSLLIVSISPESVRMLRSSCETFWPGLTEFLNKNGAKSGELFAGSEEPEHVVAMRANLIAAGYSGREAELQFFHLAPFSVHRMRSANEDPVIDSVVRVDLSTPKLHAMLKILMEANLPEEWK